MTEEPVTSRIASFQEVWKENTQSPAFAPQVRLELEAHLTHLLTRIEQAWYDSEAVLQTAEEITSEIPDSITPRLESAFSGSLYGLNEEITDALHSDRKRLDERPDLQEILAENIDSDAIEEAVEDTEYNIQSIKSTLFGEVANTSRREEKKSLNLYGLVEQIQDCRGELGSSDFKQRYRRELVEPIQEYLSQGNTEVALERLISELLGELHSTGWEDDSVEEAIDILEDPDDVDEFCAVLRGERYTREYCVPLPDDSIPEPHLNVAGVDFYMRGAEEFTYLDDLIDMDERVEQSVERSTQNTDFFAVFELVAPTQEVGEKRMEQKLERAIDALNYSKSKGVVQSPFTQSRTTYISLLPNGRWNIHSSNHHKYALPHQFRVPDEGVEVLEEYFEFFDKNKENFTSLEKRFIQSYRWYGDGVQSGIPEEEFLKYVISMESMLVPETSGSKKNRLAQRLADLRGIYDKYRDSFKDDVTALYDTRNTLVHSAEIDIPDIDQEVSSARTKATKMFGVILEEHIDEYDEIEELLEELDSRDVPEAPDDHNPLVNN